MPWVGVVSYRQNLKAVLSLLNKWFANITVLLLSKYWLWQTSPRNQAQAVKNHHTKHIVFASWPVFNPVSSFFQPDFTAARNILWIDLGKSHPRVGTHDFTHSGISIRTQVFIEFSLSINTYWTPVAFLSLNCSQGQPSEMHAWSLFFSSWTLQ